MMVGVLALLGGVAAAWYVDGDATRCPGDGSDAAPFCTIQEAFDNPELAPGDEILVRDAAVPYAGGMVNGVDGQIDSPIVIRPDDGHAPIIGGTGLEVRSSSYWEVRDLTFEQPDPGDRIAILMVAVDDDEQGNVVAGNTIIGWGNDILDDGVFSDGTITVRSSNGSSTTTMFDAVVVGNRIVDSRGTSIRFSSVDGGRIEGNEISGVRCQLDGTDTSDNFTPGMHGMHLQSVDDLRITGNHIHDFDAQACHDELPSAPNILSNVRITALWTQGADNLRIDHNLIERIGMSEGFEEGRGIHLINGSDGVVVDHNIVVDARVCGLCLAGAASGGGDNSRWLYNTVIGAGDHGIDVVSGNNPTVIGNLVAFSADAQIRWFPDDAPDATFDFNLYWSETPDNIGQINFGSEQGLEDWRSACGCDAASVSGDPAVPDVPEGFTVADTSPAVDAGGDVPELSGFNGMAPDIGALEAPVAVAAEVTTDDPRSHSTRARQRRAGTAAGRCGVHRLLRRVRGARGVRDRGRRGDRAAPRPARVRGRGADAALRWANGPRLTAHRRLHRLGAAAVHPRDRQPVRGATECHRHRDHRRCRHGSGRHGGRDFEYQHGGRRLDRGRTRGRRQRHRGRGRDRLGGLGLPGRRRLHLRSPAKHERHAVVAGVARARDPPPPSCELAG